MDRAESIRLIKQNAGKPKVKEPYQMRKTSLKKQAKLLEEKEGKDELWDWFLDRRREMTGECLHCGEKSEKDNDKYFHFSIAHILPKQWFDSAKTHPLNWIELCHFGKSCHTNLDNCIIDMTDLNCWGIVVERFIAMYPSIDPKERKYIPDALRQYIKNEIDI